MLRLILCVLIFTLTLFSNGKCDDGILTFPLVHHKSARQAMMEHGIHPQDIHGQKPKPKPPRTNDSVRLEKSMDYEYYALVGIGKPPQQFKITFDTAWGDSWVPSEKCNSQACNSHAKYDSSLSSMYVPNGKEFQVGNTTGEEYIGFLSTDRVIIAHLSINLTFAELTVVPNDLISGKPDGVFGMAFDSLSTTNSTPFFYTLVKQNLIAKPVFSFYFNRDYTTPRGGSLFLGGADPKHYDGEFTFLPVTSSVYWEVRMDRLEVYIKTKKKTVTFCTGGCQVTLDSSVTMISGPSDNVTGINKLLKAEFDNNHHFYVVSCKEIPKLPNINFVFAGKAFTLTSKDYTRVVQNGTDTICITTFKESPSPTWNVGAAFMMKYYTQFDLKNKRIGFARCK